MARHSVLSSFTHGGCPAPALTQIALVQHLRHRVPPRASRGAAGGTPGHPRPRRVLVEGPQPRSPRPSLAGTPPGRPRPALGPRRRRAQPVCVASPLPGRRRRPPLHLLPFCCLLCHLQPVQVELARGRAVQAGRDALNLPLRKRATGDAPQHSLPGRCSEGAKLLEYDRNAAAAGRNTMSITMCWIYGRTCDFLLESCGVVEACLNTGS